MKNWKRSLALLLCGAMALSLFACGAAPQATNGDPSDAPSASADLDPAASADPSPAIVADLSQPVLEFAAGVSPTDTMLTVNGQDVPADLFLYMVGSNCSYAQSYLPYFGMTLADVADTMVEESVAMAVYHTLIRQKAAELGRLPTDAQTEEIRTAMDEADLETNAPYWGLTDGSAEFIFAMNAYYNNVLEATTHAPSNEELEQYMAGKGVFAVKHILLKTTDDSNQPLPDEEAAAKKTLAGDLLSQLQAADAEAMPALFDELMQANSDDGGLESNPDGYVFDADDSLVGGFREAALELDIGQLSGIVETDYGYHIMLRLPLTEETIAQYRDTYRPDALEDIIAQWQDEASITRSDALSGLDAAVFYERLAAYQQALAERDAPAESSPVESGGVG